MTENDYLTAWGLYAVAALGCLLVWFKLTGWMWRYLREPLWVLAAVLLFTPTLVEKHQELYAPALAISALDLGLKVGSNVWQALSDLTMYGMFAFIAYLVFVAIRWPFLKRRQQRLAAQEAAAAQRAAAEKAEVEAQRSDDAYPADGRSRADSANPPPRDYGGNGRTRVEPRL